jgi:hypothetical protein
MQVSAKAERRPSRVLVSVKTGELQIPIGGPDYGFYKLP